jgi:hypothetical protein
LGPELAFRHYTATTIPYIHQAQDLPYHIHQASIAVLRVIFLRQSVTLQYTSIKGKDMHRNQIILLRMVSQSTTRLGRL